MAHGVVLDCDKKLSVARSGDGMIGRRRNRETGIVVGFFNSNLKMESD
jgi:hypothetical protein